MALETKNLRSIKSHRIDAKAKPFSNFATPSVPPARVVVAKPLKASAFTPLRRNFIDRRF